MLDAKPLPPLEDQRWRPLRPAVRQRPRTGIDPASLAVLLVLFAVLFNAGLAIVNAHIMPLSATAVIGMEVAIVAAAHALVLWNYRPQMLPWYAMIVVIVLFAIERSIVLGQFEPKFLRDVLLIPTFVLLGMIVPKHRITALVVALHVIVVAGVLFEAFFTEAFSRLFEVRSYYLSTRPFDAANFWNATSDLFVSATRPGNRFISFVDFHRISSVFLEPVSLGNYVVIITAFLCANYRYMNGKVRSFLIVGNLIALVGCDGRHAAVSSAIIVLAAYFAPLLPRKTALLYLPGFLVCAALFVVLFDPNSLEDNFTGRIAYCIELLTRYDVSDWLGNSDRLLGPAADSGIAYAIATQSIVGLIAFWTFLVMNAEERTLYQIRYLNGVCLYLALTMLVSYSLFSIKTAALLWFIYGSFQAATMTRTTNPRTVSPRAPNPRGAGWTQAPGFRRELGPRPI